MEENEPSAGRFLISYAHESDEHVAAVRRFHSVLCEQGLDVVIDVFADEERQDWVLWTLRQMEAAERVLVVASPRYRDRFEATAPRDEGRGVRLEGLLIREGILRDMEAGVRRFIPVLLPGGAVEDIPTLLQPYSATHYPVSQVTAEGVRRIVRLLRRDPRTDPEPSPTRATEGIDGPVAALRLAVRGGTPAASDAAVREFLAVGARPLGIEFDEDTRSRGAVLSARPEDAVSALALATRRLSGVVELHGTGSEASVRMCIGGHVASSHAEAVSESAALAGAAAAHRMHAVPGAGLVVVASSPMYRWISEVAAARPGPEAYREMPIDGAAGRPVYVAVPGRSVCPPLPVGIDGPRGGRGAGAEESAAGAHGAGHTADHRRGVNTGVINHGSGTVVQGSGNVVNGSGTVVYASRDAHVTFGSGS